MSPTVQAVEQCCMLLEGANIFCIILGQTHVYVEWFWVCQSVYREIPIKHFLGCFSDDLHDICASDVKIKGTGIVQIIDLRQVDLNIDCPVIPLGPPSHPIFTLVLQYKDYSILFLLGE